MDIFEAVRNGNIPRIKELLLKGTDVDLKSKFGDTSLMYASQYNISSSNVKVIKLLLENEADINLKNMTGETSLMRASYLSSIETVKLLIEAGADINAQDNSGWSSLMFASRHSNTTSSIKTVELLIKYGADVNLKNNEMNTSLMYLFKSLSNINSDSYKLMELMIEKGADVNAQDIFGWTSLMKAHSNSNIVKILIKHGADPFIKNNLNKTVLDILDFNYYESRKIISKYIFDIMMKNDKLLAKQYSKSTPLLKDIWEIILLHKRYMEIKGKTKHVIGNKHRGRYLLILDHLFEKLNSV